MTLHTNFRSVPGIIDFVNAVFQEIFGAGTIAGQAAHHPLQAARPLPTDDGVAHGPVGSQESGAGPVQLAFPGIDSVATGRGASSSAGGKRPPAAVVIAGEAMEASAPEVRRRAAADAADAADQIVNRRWLVEDTTSANAARRAGATSPSSFRPARRSPPWRAPSKPAACLTDSKGRPCSGGRKRSASFWLSCTPLTIPPMPSPSWPPCARPAWPVATTTWSPGTPPGNLGSPDRASAGLENQPVAVAMAVLDRLHRRRWWTEPSAMVAAAFDELRSFELALSHRRPRDHWHRLRWLQDQARLFDESPGGTLGAFLAWAELRAAGDGRSGASVPPTPTMTPSG